MTREEFVAKYRKKLGCLNPDERICWCEKCTKIELFWTSQIKHIVMILEDYAKTIESSSPQKDAVNAAIGKVKECL